MYILFIGAEVNYFLYNYINEKIEKKDPNSKILKLRSIIKGISVKALIEKRKKNTSVNKE